MKLDKLLPAVRRELTTNPLKAAVLALLLAAAAWFWGPIAWRWLGGKPTAQQPLVASAASAASQNPATGKGQSETRSAPTESWSQLLEARQKDPLAQPAKFDPQWPQPFKVTALATTTSGQAEHAEAVLTPAQAGLVLESIVYGATRRAAMINGEVYREGSEVAVSTAAGAAASFQVVHIDRSSVALQRYGRTYRLEFPRPKLTTSKAADQP